MEKLQKAKELIQDQIQIVKDDIIIGIRSGQGDPLIDAWYIRGLEEAVGFIDSIIKEDNAN